MTVEEAIKTLKKTAFLVNPTDPDRVDKAIDTIEAGINSMKWIPISEKLPSKTGPYLVQYKKINMPDITTYFKHDDPDEDRWATDYDFDRTNDDVDAWMPLPETYKGE